ncbi:glycosyltransferase [Phenylobacterium sp.]|jgi:glycosyltransferase involved in cell wall biosynthesis|uniref:glycosyltransferase family 2 protein n=1 Tax=Phenylobacterium sp. TaxID=1871053 RepID=UPI0011FB20FD|nr:glycosyltransferase [Phenylobacterium sp.]THD68388.1 MAG: hypothetical protein E8A12_04620 [Phenylobacterium sp.]
MARPVQTRTTAPEFDVTIVVCTRDRCADLRTMLEHLAHAETPAGWRAELLVVDNGSSDETLRSHRRPSPRT